MVCYAELLAFPSSSFTYGKYIRAEDGDWGGWVTTTPYNLQYVHGQNVKNTTFICCLPLVNLRWSRKNQLLHHFYMLFAFIYKGPTCPPPTQPPDVSSIGQIQ